MSELRIRCRNTGKKIKLPFGSNLYEAFAKADLHMDYGPVAARVNNKVQGMNYRFYNNKDVEFLSLSDESGMRTYTRTLFFILAKPSRTLIRMHNSLLAVLSVEVIIVSFVLDVLSRKRMFAASSNACKRLSMPICLSIACNAPSRKLSRCSRSEA